MTPDGRPLAAQPAPPTAQLGQRVLAEFIGTALLLIAVIGSGIAAQNLSPGDTGLELLENAAATGAALVAIILAVGSVSGAHLNPGGELRRCVLWWTATRGAGGVHRRPDRWRHRRRDHRQPHVCACRPSASRRTCAAHPTCGSAK